MEREEERESMIKELTQKLDVAEMGIIVEKTETINLLGKTGAGKSTILCLLSGFPPTISTNDNADTIVDFHQEGDFQIKIGHSTVSCTTIPNYKKIENKTYWDCPGFCDNKSIAQEIVNLFCIKKIFDASTGFKIILVIEFGSINAARGKDIAETFKYVVELFPEQDKLFNSLSIVITKCTNRNYTIQNFVNFLAKMAQENNEFESSRPLINMIIRAPERISIFKVPENESCINQILRDEVESGINSSSYIKIQIKNSMSDRAKLAIDHLIIDYEREIEKTMGEFARSLKVKFRSEKDMIVLKKGKQALDEFSSLSNDEYNNLKHFEANFIKLAEYFTGSEVLLNKIQNLAYRIEFYNSYRSDNSLPINLSNSIVPILKAKSKIESLIDFQNEVIARQQAEEYNKQNEAKIDELKKLIETINSNHNKTIQQFQETIKSKDEKNFRAISEMHERNKKLARELEILSLFDRRRGPCNVF